MQGTIIFVTNKLKMLLRRAYWLKRVFLLLMIVYYLHWKFGFEPDAYYTDAKMGHYIRSNFPLPQMTSFHGAFRMVHFMHRSHKILPEYERFLTSWRQVYPNYHLYFWTDADIKRLVSSRYPELQSFYEMRLSNPLERSDFARVLILHAFGGWYADLDAGCQLHAESLAAKHSLIVPLEPFMHAMVAFNRRRLVNNAIMYSLPGHPFLMFLVRRIVDRVLALPITPRKNVDAVQTTGPLTMTLAMEQYAAAHIASCGDLREGLGQSFGCPYVPGPRRFLPLIDNSSNWLSGWAKIMCRSVFLEAGIIDECRRLRSSDFINVLPSDSYTYHAFLHLTGVKGAETNVSSWGLDIRLKPMDYL